MAFANAHQSLDREDLKGTTHVDSARFTGPEFTVTYK
jgi:hypothetical protein